MARPDEVESADARARARRKRYPTAISAAYDARRKMVVVALSSGVEIAFAPKSAQGLEVVSADDLKAIEISPSGYGLHFPKVDADIYLPALLDGFLGSKAWTAARLGESGGKVSTMAKAAAARRNGKLGGRPRKVPA